MFVDAGKRTTALRIGFALRAGLGFIIVSLVAGAGFFIRYEIMHVAQPARYGFWSVLGAGFIAIWGASSALWFSRRSARAKVFIGASLGLLLGVWWAFVVYFPMGLFPGVLGVPVIVLWPCAAALSFAYAAALVPHTAEPARFGVGGVLALGALCWIGFVKGGLNRIAEPLDFARMVAPRRLHTPLGVAALDRGECVDPVPARVALALDSTTRLTALGNFTDVASAALSTEAIGHSVRLWRGGAQTVGIVSTWLGRGAGRHAWIENVSLDQRGRLRFDAFYSDGFFDHFDGLLQRGRLRGTITTADALCVRRVLAHDEVKLRRANLPRNLPFASAQPTTFADFQTVFGSVYTRP